MISGTSGSLCNKATLLIIPPLTPTPTTLHPHPEEELYMQYNYNNSLFITLQVSRIIRHRDYRESGRRGFPNDIALLSLSSPIDLSDQYVSTVQMASSGENFIDNECWITGWGKTSRWSGIPDVLQVRI